MKFRVVEEEMLGNGENGGRGRVNSWDGGGSDAGYLFFFYFADVYLFYWFACHLTESGIHAPLMFGCIFIVSKCLGVGIKPVEPAVQFVFIQFFLKNDSLKN
ncbi:hypothetical protein K7X08_008748 [Anisodus acutangulus]|uniref:Uncharacterized protein n=1 Tax=Anisodus acutangulus TaxID=402998 RepID=A0A9Q1MY13_9SOLA|nr:hypothetical protein K7X08_008748 [Anisodus acutangulus]